MLSSCILSLLLPVIDCEALEKSGLDFDGTFITTFFLSTYSVRHSARDLGDLVSESKFLALVELRF